MQALLFDLDGVFYVGKRAIDGAASVLHWCQTERIPYLFITNTTSRPPQSIIDKLNRFGIVTDVASILSPPVAAVQWLKAQTKLRIGLYVAGATRTVFSEFNWVESEEQPVDAVVIGDMGEAWDFVTMTRAFRQLMQQPAPTLIALGMTRYWRAPDGLRLDAGAYTTALQYASGIEPVVLGKPAAAFFQAALDKLGTVAEQTWMIGDDIKSDIEGAQHAGLNAVLVRTGKFRPADLELSIHPQAVIDSIAELPGWWRDTLAKQNRREHRR